MVHHGAAWKLYSSGSAGGEDPCFVLRAAVSADGFVLLYGDHAFTVYSTGDFLFLLGSGADHFTVCKVVFAGWKLGDSDPDERSNGKGAVRQFVYLFDGSGDRCHDCDRDDPNEKKGYLISIESDRICVDFIGGIKMHFSGT